MHSCVISHTLHAVCPASHVRPACNLSFSVTCKGRIHARLAGFALWHVHARTGTGLACTSIILGSIVGPSSPVHGIGCEVVFWYILLILTYGRMHTCVLHLFSQLKHGPTLSWHSTCLACHDCHQYLYCHCAMTAMLSRTRPTSVTLTASCYCPRQSCLG